MKLGRTNTIFEPYTDICREIMARVKSCQEAGITMRKMLSIVAAFIALIGPAASADEIEPIYRSPAASWFGLYVGVSAGYLVSSINYASSSTNTLVFPASSPLANAISSLTNFSVSVANGGFEGGGKIGYNFYQVPWFSNWLVAGAEADVRTVAGRGSSGLATTIAIGSTNSLNQTVTISERVDYLGTLRGRVGISAGFLEAPVLYYATAGIAVGEMRGSTTMTQSMAGPNSLGLTAPSWTAYGSRTNTRFGVAAGLGAEWRIFQHVSTSVEWLHYDLGMSSYDLTPLVSNAGATSRPFTVNTVTATNRFRSDSLHAAVIYRF
jgi:opacity protein-like surface antigen